MLEDIRVAIIVNPDLPLGLIANTVAAIGIGIGAKLPALASHTLTDSAGRTIDVSSHLPVPVLQGDTGLMQALLLKASETHNALAVVPFPAFARSLHDFGDYQSQFPQRDLQREPIDGVGLAGAAKWIKSVTGALKLLR